MAQVKHVVDALLAVRTLEGLNIEQERERLVQALARNFPELFKLKEDNRNGLLAHDFEHHILEVDKSAQPAANVPVEPGGVALFDFEVELLVVRPGREHVGERQEHIKRITHHVECFVRFEIKAANAVREVRLRDPDRVIGNLLSQDS